MNGYSHNLQYTTEVAPMDVAQSRIIPVKTTSREITQIKP